MSTTVVGLFDEFDDAQRAVNDLHAAGFAHTDISMVSNNVDSRFGTHEAGSSAGSHVRGLVGGAAEGAMIGGLTGLAASLALMMIPGIGPIAAVGPLAATLSGAGLGAVGGGLIGGLAGAGVPREDAALYAEGVRRGGTLVTVRADESRADEAGRILDRYNPVDIEHRGGYYRSTGFTGYQENAPVYTREQIQADRTAYRNFSTPATTASTNMPSRTETSVNTAVNTNVNNMNTVNSGDRTVIPIVEEELQVGKREVERGHTRIRSYVTERPVEEQVTLREEHVHVERHPVNRPITDADANAFREQTIEVRERAEEAVVAKQARVVEEVVVNKEATQRTETVRDTVRRTDVDVDELDNDDASLMGARHFDRFNDDFRNDFTTRYGSTAGANYEHFQPAYRFGYDLASDARYQNAHDWSSIEPTIRSDWESRGYGTWDRFKDAVHFAWDRARMGVNRVENRVTR